MPTLTRKDLQNRISKNNSLYKESVKHVQTDIQRRNLKRGRIRPRDTDEAEILARFERKQYALF